MGGGYRRAASPWAHSVAVLGLWSDCTKAAFRISWVRDIGRNEVNRALTTTLLFTAASACLAQDGPLKVRTIDLDLSATFPKATVATVPVEPPVPVLRGAEVVIDAIDLSRTKTDIGGAAVQFSVALVSGGETIGFADIPDLQLISRADTAANTRRVRIPVSGEGAIDAVRFVLTPVVTSAPVADLEARVTGLAGSTEATLYVAYGVRDTIRSPHGTTDLSPPSAFAASTTSVSVWQTLDARDADNSRLGDTGLITLGTWNGLLAGTGSIMAEARVRFGDGTELTLDDAHSPSTGEPRDPAEGHSAYDNALAIGPAAAERIESVDVRVSVVFDGIGAVDFFPMIPFTIRAYKTNWRCYADANQDGILNIFDYLAFQNAFMDGDPYADCDSDGVLTIFDFLCYQNSFDTGEACP